MIELPKSLTAVVHVRLHYREAEAKATESSIGMLSKLLDHASELSTEHQELLIKFAILRKHATKVSEEDE